MTDPDRDPAGDDHPADPAAASGVERELTSLDPVAPSAGLRGRIAAELATPARMGSTPRRMEPARGGAVRWTVDRLAWAAVGAVAATFVIGLPAREAGPPKAPAPQAAAEVVSTAPRPDEQAIGWADEGVRFLPDATPARVLRRFVVERHRAADGVAEVRVPREDVILLPVALR